MIKLTKINNETIYINDSLIEFIEETPDVMLTLTTGRKIIVIDSVEAIINKIIEYKSKIYKK